MLHVINGQKLTIFLPWEYVLCTKFSGSFKIVSIISGLILSCRNGFTHPSRNTKLVFVNSNWLNVCVLKQTCCESAAYLLLSVAESETTVNKHWNITLGAKQVRLWNKLV